MVLLEMCRDFVNFLQVFQDLAHRCANLFSKVCFLLATQLDIPPQQLPIQHLVLGSVQVLVASVEGSERAGTKQQITKASPK